MDCEYAINGQRLDAANCRVAVGTTWLAGISPTRDVLNVPGMHGSVPSSYPPVFDEREVTVKIGIAGEAAFLADTQRIVALCALPNVTLTRVADGITQSAQVELKSLAPDGDEVFGRVEQLTAVFALPGVWWRGVDWIQASVPLSGGRLIRGSIRLPSAGYWTQWEGTPNNSNSLLADFATMWQGEANDSPSILTDGWSKGSMSDAPIVDALVRVPASATSVSVTDPMTNTGVSWSGTRSKPWLYLDASNLRAWESDSASAWSGGTDKTNGIDYPANGPLQLWPDSNADYRVSAKTTGAASDATLLFRFKQSWW